MYKIFMTRKIIKTPAADEVENWAASGSIDIE